MNPLKIYIAGASAELHRAENAIALARRSSCEITLDWPPFIRAHGGDVKDNRPGSERAKNATDDIDAVIDADIIWCLIPMEQTKGMWCELGAALALNQLAKRDPVNYGHHETMIVCSWEVPSFKVHGVPLFVEPSTRQFSSDDAACHFIKRCARDGLESITRPNFG